MNTATDCVSHKHYIHTQQDSNFLFELLKSATEKPLPRPLGARTRRPGSFVGDALVKLEVLPEMFLCRRALARLPASVPSLMKLPTL